MTTGIDMKVDLSQLAHGMGIAMAMEEALAKQSMYTDLATEYAIKKANKEFNLEAAAFASAGGNIKHMFEWGTNGINTGRSNVRPAPTSERARLWKLKIDGYGMSKTIDFDYKPSVGNVPLPTVRDTGISAEVIAKMRHHVFWNKAFVMETDEVVHIAPNEAQFLLIPAYPNNRPYLRPHDVKRGYGLLPRGTSIIARPGASSKGQFSAFFGKWWNGRGAELINQYMTEQVDEDFVQPPTMTSSVSTTPYLEMLKRYIEQTTAEAQIKAEARIKEIDRIQ